MTSPSELLRYFAELAPAGRRGNFNRAPAVADFAELPAEHLTPEPVPAPHRAAPPVAQRGNPVSDRQTAQTEWHRSLVPPTRTMRWTVRANPKLDRLLAVERLHAHEHLLRMGWLFVTGSLPADGETRRVWFPLAEAPARLVRLDDSAYSLTIDRELQMPSAIFDLDTRDDLEDELLELAAGVFASRRSMTRFAPERDPAALRLINEALRRVGLGRPGVLGRAADPMESYDGVVVCPTVALYTARDVDAPDLSAALQGWAARPQTGTAFGAMYGMGRRSRPGPSRRPTVHSPMPLNGRQEAAVVAARYQDVTVVSGPPGTGKTHVAAAIAIDTVAQGGSVLVCAQSDHAIEALVELFERYPGPRWVRFGNRNHLDRVADELSGGRPAARNTQGMGARQEALRTARTEAVEIRRHTMERLGAELDFAASLDRRDRLGWSVRIPGDADPADVDWDEVESTVAALRRPEPGVFAWFEQFRRRRRFVDLFGPDALADLGAMDEVIALGRAEATVAKLVERGGVTVSDVLAKLESAEARVRERVGQAIAYAREAAAGSLGDEGRAAATLATALRSGATARRRLLREVNAADFLKLLPLWVGTLGEVDDTLPMEPAMFDLVVLDEASQINQVRAAAALSRGARCVIVGDPRQLRHVSFVADEAMRTAAARQGLDPILAATADVRRNSMFDVAAGVSAVVELDEHFRSVPHIIGFSNRRFYESRLRLMTVHPSNEKRDAIDIVTVPGSRDSSGVNDVEVRASIDLARRLMDETDHNSTIGILSPFRAQADAVEAAVLDAFDVATIERCGLRVGTVHGFQGAERDITLVTLAVDDGAGARQLRFLQDPHLFNVMVTRARRLVTVVTSVGEWRDLPAGLLRDYLRHSEHPPRPADAAAPPSGWRAELAARIEGYGLRVVADYPVAGYKVDLAVGDDEAAVGVECVVHPDGPEAHIERHLALRRAGWRILDAFESRWLARPDAAVDQIVQAVLRRR